MRSLSRLRNDVGEPESLDEVVKSRLGEESFVEEENDPFKKAHSEWSKRDFIRSEC
jgi:hypothetical protein